MFRFLFQKAETIDSLGPWIFRSSATKFCGDTRLVFTKEGASNRRRQIFYCSGSVDGWFLKKKVICWNSCCRRKASNLLDIKSSLPKKKRESLETFRAIALLLFYSFLQTVDSPPKNIIFFYSRHA